MGKKEKLANHVYTLVIGNSRRMKRYKNRDDYELSLILLIVRENMVPKLYAVTCHSNEGREQAMPELQNNEHDQSSEKGHVECDPAPPHLCG